MRSICFLLVVFVAAHASAKDLTVLPASRHQQFLSYGIFTEEQSNLLLRDGGKAWGGIGMALPLAELSSWASRPQIVISGTVVTGLSPRGGVRTIDGRFALALEFSFTEALRLSFALEHASGHIGDADADAALMPINVGDDSLVVRGVYDIASRFRFGVSLRPLIGADPEGQHFAADQFAEWFPFGTNEEQGGTPYLALGLQEFGLHDLALTWHAQAGVYFGSHLGEVHRPTLRFVLGFYHGRDPSLKMAQLAGAFATFPYVGVAVNF